MIIVGASLRLGGILSSFCLLIFVIVTGIKLNTFSLKKIRKTSAAEAHKILLETYDDHDLSEITCRDWFRCYKNNDFDVEDKEHSGATKKFEGGGLEELLNDNSCQTLAKLAESLGVDDPTVSKRLKDPKANTLGVVCVEAEKCQTASFYA